jgi:hypothetical protein
VLYPSCTALSSYSLVEFASHIGPEDSADLVTDPAEDRESLFLGSRRQGGVFKGKVEAAELARKIGAGFAGVVAHGDDRADLFPLMMEELVQMLGAMARKVDPHFCHDLDGEGMNKAGRPGTGTRDRFVRPQGIPKEAFRHMGAATVAGAQNKNHGTRKMVRESVKCKLPTSSHLRHVPREKAVA